MIALAFVNFRALVLHKIFSLTVQRQSSYMHRDWNVLFGNKRKYKSNFLRTIRKCSYFKHKYSCEVEKLVNKQIQAEQQAAQDYLNMAVIFLHPCISRPGAGGFFMRMHEEELGHMQEFIQYQLMRGGTTVIDSVNAPTQDPKLTLLGAFQRGLEMEKAVTELLEKLVLAAEKEKDYQCADFVTSVFLQEQMRSLNEMSHHVTKLSKLKDEHAIYHYDLQLVKTYPYTFKSKRLKM